TWSVMQNIWLLMIDFAAAMTAIFAHNGIAFTLCDRLNRITNITQGRARLHSMNPGHHGFIGGIDQSLGFWRWRSDIVHPAGITEITVFNNGNINIDNIAILKNDF